MRELIMRIVRRNLSVGCNRFLIFIPAEECRRAHLFWMDQIRHLEFLSGSKIANRADLQLRTRHSTTVWQVPFVQRFGGFACLRVKERSLYAMATRLNYLDWCRRFPARDSRFTGSGRLPFKPGPHFQLWENIVRNVHRASRESLSVPSTRHPALGGPQALAQDQQGNRQCLRTRFAQALRLRGAPGE